MKYIEEFFLNFIAVAAPYIVLIVTLIYNNKENNRRIKEDWNIFNENKEITNKNHEEILAEQKEKTRLLIMPYFILSKKNVKIYKNDRNDDLVIIDFTLINKGNGTAISVINKYLSDATYNSIVVAKTYTYDYLCFSPFDWNINCAIVNETIREKICFNENNIKFKSVCEINDEQFEFTIIYKDMCYKKYEQTFFMQIHKDNDNSFELLRVESHEPLLIE